MTPVTLPSVVIFAPNSCLLCHSLTIKAVTENHVIEENEHCLVFYFVFSEEKICFHASPTLLLSNI